MTSRNQRVLLIRRPVRAVKPTDFEVADEPMPIPGYGQLLLRNLYLSIDPYLRGRMNATEGSYADPFPLGQPMGGGTYLKLSSRGTSPSKPATS